MIRSTSCPWNPTSVNFVASTCLSHFTPAVEQPGMHHHKKNESHKRDNTKRPETASKQRMKATPKPNTDRGRKHTNKRCLCVWPRAARRGSFVCSSPPGPTKHGPDEGASLTVYTNVPPTQCSDDSKQLQGQGQRQEHRQGVEPAWPLSHLDERRLGHLGHAARDLRLPAAGGPDHQDVLRDNVTLGGDKTQEGRGRGEEEELRGQGRGSYRTKQSKKKTKRKHGHHKHAHYDALWARRRQES